jgi:hypothetical protein
MALPWDMVRATEAANGNQEGDLLFVLSDDGYETLRPIFENIESTCGSLMKRDESQLKFARRDTQLFKRDTTSCAIEQFEMTELASMDVGVSFSPLFTVTSSGIATTLANSTPAVAVLMSIWLAYQGTLSPGYSTKIPGDQVDSVNDAFVQPEDGGDDTTPDDEDDVVPYLPEIQEDYGDQDNEIQIESVLLSGEWYNYPFWERQQTHSWSVPDPICQQSDIAAYQWESDGTPDVHSTAMSWCDKYSGKALDPDGVSTFFDKYIFDDHSCKSHFPSQNDPY